MSVGLISIGIEAKIFLVVSGNYLVRLSSTYTLMKRNKLFTPRWIKFVDKITKIQV